MCRKQKIIDIAAEEAYKSDINIRHGAVITKGNKVICKGYNTSRTKIKSLNTLELCSHAEMTVARIFYNTYITHLQLHLCHDTFLPNLYPESLSIGYYYGF